MRIFLLVVLFSVISVKGISQNYFRENPITTTIAFNGPLQRLECSTFDSTLQTTVYYYSPWMSYNIFVSSNAFGKVGFTTWVTPGQQHSLYGFIIYDYVLHQFDVQMKNINTANQNVNVICGRIWVKVVVEYNNQGNYTPTYFFYRYNMNFHNWGVASFIDYDEDQSVVWSQSVPGNSDLIVYIDHLDEMDLFYYDPVSNNMSYLFSGCAGWHFYAVDDYIEFDTGCSDNFRFLTYDAGNNYFTAFSRDDLLGSQVNGVFTANDQNDPNKKFFFTYDQAIHQWLSDSVFSNYITNVQIKDRVIAYADEDPALGSGAGRVYFMVHDPLLNTLVKDSADLLGGLTQLSIQSGTVTYGDASVCIYAVMMLTRVGAISTRPCFYISI